MYLKLARSFSSAPKKEFKQHFLPKEFFSEYEQMFIDDRTPSKKIATKRAVQVFSEKVPFITERSIYRLLAPIAKINSNHDLMVEII